MILKDAYHILDPYTLLASCMYVPSTQYKQINKLYYMLILCFVIITMSQLCLNVELHLWYFNRRFYFFKTVMA